ncbi:MAG: hypothetical protein RJA36_479 [Pseudomonadota bacterium]|jgi:hypothetical protein
MTASLLLQAYIAVTGLAAIVLLQWGGERSRRWAPFIGLAGQPAWLWFAAHSGAAGVGLVSLAYTLVWAAGCVREVRRGLFINPPSSGA